MIKKEKGFTLIELLVVIAIMASILVLALVSLNGISKKKKEESYEKVKDQIEVAAKQYLETNEYLFEDLTESGTGSSKTINLETLINSDYLNTLTNPVTGKKLNKCNKVIVTKKGHNKYSYKFDDSNNTCDSNTNLVIKSPEVTDPQSPGIEIGKNCEYEVNNGWCRGEITYTVKGLKESGSDIDSVSAYTDSSMNNSLETISGDTLTLVRSDDTAETTLYFKVVNQANKTAEGSDSYKIDRTPPVCSASGGGSSWTNQDVTFLGTCSDLLSGCEVDNISSIASYDLKQLNNYKFGTLKDKAGNTADCIGNARIDKKKPTVNIIGNQGKNTYETYSNNRSFTLSSSDQNNGSGINRTEYKIGSSAYTQYNNSSVVALTNTGTKTIKARTYDNAGNVSDESTKELVCNKDHVTVDRNLYSDSFELTFSNSNGSQFEYVIYGQTATKDDADTAQSRKYTINGKEYSYSSWAVAKQKCAGSFEAKIENRKTVGSKTEKITIKQAPGKSYLAMYYCLAVRPKRSDRSSLTGIGNYYRKELIQPTTKTVNNTGWTIEYKHVIGGT